MEKVERIIGLLLAIVLSIVLVLLTWQVAKELSLLDGFPKGRDAYAYLTKIKYILEYFPHVFWNPFWDSGTPTWLWSYPPASMHLAAAISYFFHQNPEAALSWMAFGSFTVFILGVFWFIFNLSKNSVLAFLVALILIYTPASWGWWADGGNYVRVFGLGALGFFLFTYSGFLVYKNRLFWVVTVFSFALALTSHFLIGALVFLIFVLETLFYSNSLF